MKWGGKVWYGGECYYFNPHMVALLILSISLQQLFLFFFSPQRKILLTADDDDDDEFFLSFFLSFHLFILNIK